MNQREIKFRAWDKIKKEMGDVRSIEWVNDDIDVRILLKDPIMGGGYRVSRMGDNCELMQYTGLKDINGKEICEGDCIIISAVDFSHSFPEVIDDIFKAHNLVGESSTHWEVIGNIYENAELIK